MSGHVQGMFDEFMSVNCPLIPKDSIQYRRMREAFFMGAKCIVALCGSTLQPRFPGDKLQLTSMMRVLRATDEETLEFFNQARGEPAPVVAAGVQ